MSWFFAIVFCAVTMPLWLVVIITRLLYGIVIIAWRAGGDIEDWLRGVAASPPRTERPKPKNEKN